MVRTCEKVGRCGHLTKYIHVLQMRSMYKIERKEGGGSKNFILGNHQKVQDELKYKFINFKMLLIFIETNKNILVPPRS